MRIVAPDHRDPILGRVVHLARLAGIREIDVDAVGADSRNAQQGLTCTGRSCFGLILGSSSANGGHPIGDKQRQAQVVGRAAIEEAPSIGDR
ncbi:hypothetical protein D9M70_649240 [compost metagenome]